MQLHAYQHTRQSRPQFLLLLVPIHLLMSQVHLFLQIDLLLLQYGCVSFETTIVVCQHEFVHGQVIYFC